MVDSALQSLDTLVARVRRHAHPVHSAQFTRIFYYFRRLYFSFTAIMIIIGADSEYLYVIPIATGFDIEIFRIFPLHW